MTMPDLAPGAPSRVVDIDVTVLTEDAPKTGSITFVLEGDLRVPDTGKIIAASQKVVELVGGKGQIRLPTVSASVQDDVGDAWYVLVKKSWMRRAYAIRVPSGTGSINLAALAPALTLTPQETAWRLSAASVSVQSVSHTSPATGSVSLQGGTLAFNLRIPQGAQGLPGPGAVAADDAVATYVQEPSQTRTALDRVYRRGYSPREYGVVGDGVADDTAAWNAAVASVPEGATITCPEGDRYRLTGPVTVAQAVTIEGGTWLPRTTGRMLDITTGGVTARGLRIESTSSTPEATHHLIHAEGSPTGVLDGITVEDVTIRGARYVGIWVEWARHVRVTGCDVQDFQYAGIMLVSCHDFSVTGNTARNGIMGGSLVNCYGIAASDLMNTELARSYDGHIDNNIVDNIPGWEGIDTHSGRNITFNNNVVTRCRTGIAILAGNTNRVVAPEGCTATGNVIDAMGIPEPRAGIQLLGVSGGAAASGAIGTNVIRGYGQDVIVAYHDRPRTSIAPQATDATTPGSPAGPPFRMWAAITTFTLAGQSSLTREVTFPAGLFTAAPIVTVSKHGSGGSRFVPYVTQVTKTGCTVGILDPSGTGGATTDLPVALNVVQMTSYGGGGVPQV